ncbi:MAG: TolB family protein, partial [Acidimicrobiales bacterium]
MSDAQPPEPFDLDRFLGLPRLDGLALSPGGERLVTSVAAVGPDGKKFVRSVWEIDPAGARAPRRLTRSAPGEGGPRFLPDGAIVFTSSRADPDAEPATDKDDGAERAALWLLPGDGGEARQVAATPGGVESVAVARHAGTVVLATPAFPGTTTDEQDEGRDKARREAGVKALLFESYPVRFWDHWLGPRQRRLVAAGPPPDRHDGPLGERRLVAEGDRRALDGVDFDVTPDGATVVTGWRRTDVVTNPCVDLV